MSYSVPVPKNAQEIIDCFTGIYVGAPDFEWLNNHAVTYTITLDMMMDSLVQGIHKVAERFRSSEAQDAIKACLKQVDEVHMLYREGRVDEARRLIQQAQSNFRSAWKSRVSKRAAFDLK